MSWDGFIFGSWQGHLYVWEFEKNEAFRFAVERFELAEAEAVAFAWGRARTQTACSFVAEVIPTVSFPMESGRMTSHGGTSHRVTISR
jgi:hypothetical protein